MRWSHVHRSLIIAVIDTAGTWIHLCAVHTHRVSIILLTHVLVAVVWIHAHVRAMVHRRVNAINWHIILDIWGLIHPIGVRLLLRKGFL